MGEEKKLQQVHIDVSEAGQININISGMDAITGVFVLQTAMNMVQKRIMDNSKLIIAAGAGEMPGIRKFN